jgi:hypothetical protein
MKKDPKDRKSVDLQNTQVWRDDDRTITMAGDFDPISIYRDKSPTDWANLDRFLKSQGK